MRFQPLTQTLSTDEGELIKHLYCPLGKTWEQLAATDSAHRLCAHCNRPVLDTGAMTEAEVVAAVRADPETCLRVSAFQENLTILWPADRYRRRVD